MIRDLLILPDGRELFSGAQEQVAIKSLCYSRQVSGNGMLDFCCAAAAGITVQLLDETGSFTLAADTEIKYYRVDEKGNRQLMGTFYTQKATRPGKHILEFQAYDAMILAEQDMSQWLLRQTWPMELHGMLSMVCAHCGIATQPWDLCNGTQKIEQFYQQITARQLIAYIAEANGLFAYITAEGELAMKKLTTATTPITLRDMKSYQCAQIPCAPIDGVAIYPEAGTVGVLVPNDSAHSYAITGNPVLPNYSESMLRECATRLATILTNISYTPLEAEVFVDGLTLPWKPGELVQVQIGEEAFLCAVFSIRLEGNVAQLKSWGQPRRDSAMGQHSRDTVKILQKQMTKVSVDMEGISAEITRVEAEFDAQQVQIREDISALEMASDKISAQVSRVEKTAQADMEILEQSVQSIKRQVDMAVTAEQLELSISTLTENGVEKVQTRTGYTFDQNGMSISDSRSDIQNRIDHKGMYVTRQNDVILQADAKGVSARDVTVRNFLVVGDHARLEDYQTDRTACFWL